MEFAIHRLKTKSDCELAADLLKALSHPMRLRIAAILCEGPENVNALASRLGVNQAVVSQQLRLMRMRGMIAASRENGYANYRLTEPLVKKMLACLQACLEKRKPS